MDSRYLDALTREQRRDIMLETDARQGGVCFVCEQPIDLDAVGGLAPELEHIDPLDAGGADLPANLAVLHAACGSSRPTRDLRLARELDRLGRLGGGSRPAATVAAGSSDAPPAALDQAPTSNETEEPVAPPPVRASRPEEPPPPDPEPGRSPEHERTFGSALGLTVLGAVIPGTAYLAAGRRRLGLFTLGVVALLLIAFGYLLLRNDDLTTLAAELVSRPSLTEIVGIGVLVAGALWIVVIATGHRMLLPSDAGGTQQALGGALALLLALVVAVPSVVVARYAFATRDLIEDVFESTGTQEGPPIDRDDPWKNIPRLNLLILGGDSTADGGVTTNTMIVTSIDTATGDTVMFGLPRNLQSVPIPEDNPLHALYPTGYSCGTGRGECLLSGLYTEAEVVHADLFGDDTEPGLTTLRGAVQEITGLEINYHMLVDLAGFEQIVDALGGIDINVGPRRVPIAELDADGDPQPPDASTQYIPPGQQHLDGEEALAFARERGEDFGGANRLLRQRAVIAAIADRADPVTLLLSYLDVVSTATEAINTDVPVELIPGLVELSKAVRSKEIRGVPIPAELTVTDPDFAAMRQLVATSLSGG